jgi:hypothetical protein
MRHLLLCPLVVLFAACASTSAGDLKRMSTAELCYTGMTQPEHTQLVDAELSARKADCGDHAAEIKKIEDIERRAGMGDAATTGQAARPSGGMGRY